jgi:hypothetical protein
MNENIVIYALINYKFYYKLPNEKVDKKINCNNIVWIGTTSIELFNTIKRKMNF